MPVCFSCGKSLVVVDRVGRGDACPGCGADVHCCRNCQFYDPAAYNECREPVADRVLEKDRANFCEHFVLSAGEKTADRKTEEARKKLDELFKKK